MTEEGTNLVLEHLKRFQGGQERMERKIDESAARLGQLERGQAVLISHIAHPADGLAGVQIRMDGFDKRLERIERASIWSTPPIDRARA